MVQARVLVLLQGVHPADACGQREALSPAPAMEGMLETACCQGRRACCCARHVQPRLLAPVLAKLPLVRSECYVQHARETSSSCQPAQ